MTRPAVPLRCVAGGPWRGPGSRPQQFYPAGKALTHEAGTGPVLHQPTRQVGLAPNLRARDRNQIRERRFGE